MLYFPSSALECRPEYYWREIHKQKPHFKIRVGEWDSAMEGVKPEGLEELGLMIQVLFKGMDIICEWLGRENLHRLGVEWATSEPKLVT
jgi:hypothetical protein